MTGPFDVAALWAALDARRTAEGLTWAAIGRETGVSPSTLTRTQQATDLEADGMVQMVAWLGLAPEAFCPGAPDAPAVPDAGGAGIWRVDAAALFAALDARRTAEGLTRPAVAGALESDRASAGALRGLQRGGRVSTQVLLSAARWLDTPTTTFLALRPV